MLKNNHNSNFSLYILFLVFLLLPNYSYGAIVSATSSVRSFIKGDEFIVDISIDGEDDTINGIEGTLLYPKDLVDIKELRDGNSSITFWINKPKVTNNGSLEFSGITPGGFYGKDKFIFSIVFKAKTSGEGDVNISNLKVFKNDGLGTEIKSTVTKFHFFVQKNGLSNTNLKVDEIKEDGLPESFKAEIGRDDEIFEGKSFLVFDTLDKGSGISKYEVREGFFSSFKEASSPYVLSNQNLDKMITVRAHDKMGNYRDQNIFPINWKPWYTNKFFVAIFIIFIGAVVFWGRKL